MEKLLNQIIANNSNEMQRKCAVKADATGHSVIKSVCCCSQPFPDTANLYCCRCGKFLH